MNFIYWSSDKAVRGFSAHLKSRSCSIDTQIGSISEGIKLPTTYASRQMKKVTSKVKNQYTTSQGQIQWRELVVSLVLCFPLHWHCNIFMLWLLFLLMPCNLFHNFECKSTSKFLVQSEVLLFFFFHLKAYLDLVECVGKSSWFSLSENIY